MSEIDCLSTLKEIIIIQHKRQETVAKVVKMMSMLIVSLIAWGLSWWGLVVHYEWLPDVEWFRHTAYALIYCTSTAVAVFAVLLHVASREYRELKPDLYTNGD